VGQLLTLLVVGVAEPTIPEVHRMDMAAVEQNAELWECDALLKSVARRIEVLHSGGSAAPRRIRLTIQAWKAGHTKERVEEESYSWSAVNFLHRAA